MSEQHDKFCTTYELGFCECDDIAAIRADEREQAARRVEQRTSEALHHRYSHDYNKNQCFCEMYVSDVEILIAAARGEDE